MMERRRWTNKKCAPLWEPVTHGTLSDRFCPETRTYLTETIRVRHSQSDSIQDTSLTSSICVFNEGKTAIGKEKTCEYHDNTSPCDDVIVCSSTNRQTNSIAQHRILRRCTSWWYLLPVFPYPVLRVRLLRSLSSDHDVRC